MEVKIIRRVDELGRVVIPKEFRRELELGCGDGVEICINENREIILKPVDVNAGATRMEDLVNAVLNRLKAHPDLTVKQVMDIIKDEYSKWEIF